MIETINMNDPEKAARAASIRHRNAPAHTQAYVHRGMWIADCPYPACANAERLERGCSAMHCTECRWVGSVVWPKEADDITKILNLRPVPGTRHWAPAGHRQAIACGFPEGQSVADLAEENEANL